MIVDRLVCGCGCGRVLQVKEIRRHMRKIKNREAAQQSRQRKKEVRASCTNLFSFFFFKKQNIVLYQCRVVYFSKILGLKTDT